MTPYFASKEKQAEFVLEATSFLGTPFHHHGRVKGGGVDCVGLLAELYIATGAARSVKFPSYRLNEWNILSISKVQEFLMGDLGKTLSPGLVMVEVPTEISTLLPGDIITVRVGTITHHVGAMIWRPDFVHSYISRGVIVSNLAHAAYRTRLSSVHRIVIV